MSQPSEQRREQSPTTHEGHKLEGLAAQEKNLAIFKTLSSWASPVALRGHVLSYFLRPESDKSDQRKQLADALKAQSAEMADGVQHALKSKSKTVIGMQCYMQGLKKL